MIISFSHVLSFQTCMRKYYYSYTLNKAPNTEKDSIDVGVKGHKLLQRFYELVRDGKTKEESLIVVRDLAGVDVDFNMLKAWTLVDNYIRQTDFTNLAIHVEEQFKIPASLLYTRDFDTDLDWKIGFTPDVMFERKGSIVDVEDSKFVQRMWPQAKIDRFTQVKLYKIFLDRLGYNVSRSILRLFNVATGEVRHKVYTPTKLEEEILLRDFLLGVEGVRKFNQLSMSDQIQAPRTMNYFSCQYCSFVGPCNLESQGKSASKTLASQFKNRDYGYS